MYKREPSRGKRDFWPKLDVEPELGNLSEKPHLCFPFCLALIVDLESAEEIGLQIVGQQINDLFSILSSILPEYSLKLELMVDSYLSFARSSFAKLKLNPHKANNITLTFAMNCTLGKIWI